jgi:hypothetical protein
MQEMLSKNHDKDVKTWKESVENEIKKASLMGEVLIRQEQFNKANNMDVCTIDFSEDTVANLPSYTPQVYRECKEMLPNSDNDLYEDILILQAMDEQKYTFVQVSSLGRVSSTVTKNRINRHVI